MDAPLCFPYIAFKSGVMANIVINNGRHEMSILLCGLLPTICLFIFDCVALFKKKKILATSLTEVAIPPRSCQKNKSEVITSLTSILRRQLVNQYIVHVVAAILAPSPQRRVSLPLPCPGQGPPCFQDQPRIHQLYCEFHCCQT